MQRFFRKILVFLFIAVVFLWALMKFYNPIEIGKIDSVNVNELSTNSIKLSMVVPVKNKMFFDLKILEADLDFTMNDIKAGKITSFDDEILLKALKHENVSFPVELKFENMLTNFLSLFKAFTSNEAKINIKGIVKVKFFIFTKDVPIDLDNVVKLKK